jgi:hypothetical protein
LADEKPREAQLITSWVAILVFGVAAKAEALGFKPFTNDPLGWRKAKKSYKETAGAENGEQDSTASPNR